MEIFYFLFLLPFGGALTARLAYRRLAAWTAWLAASLIAFWVIWLAEYLPADQGAGTVVGASTFGFLGPELWGILLAGLRGLGDCLRTFLSRPRNIGYLVAGAGIIFLLGQPQLFWGLSGQILMLIIILIGFKIMIKPLIGGSKRKR